MTDQLNIPLLRKTVEWVEEQDALDERARVWQQGLWINTGLSCGTAYCAAGYVLHLSGWTDSEILDVWDVGDKAAEILGINPERAWSIWAIGNKATDIRAAAERVAGEPL